MTIKQIQTLLDKNYWIKTYYIDRLSKQISSYTLSSYNIDQIQEHKGHIMNLKQFGFYIIIPYGPILTFISGDKIDTKTS